ncbi:MAG: AraC family transcriptional regulator [Candidatus Krumholzibacteria bacterium]|nr:AraC family transcriptional regulator [Candidatus Krumholzibacteria bacterium]
MSDQDILIGGPFVQAAKSLFDQVPDVVFFVKDRNARYVVANQTLVERCGVDDIGDLFGKTVLEIFPSPLGEAYFEQDRRVLDQGTEIKDLLELHLYARGEPGWCVTNKVPLKNEEGEIIGLMGVSKDLHKPADEAKGYRELAESVRYIQMHYAEALRVEEIARMSGLSVYQYEKRMKEIFQLTAGQFIAKTRIEAACRLLRSTKMSIADVAVGCGFYDQSAFTRQFKSTTGLTPSKYRTRIE